MKIMANNAVLVFVNLVKSAGFVTGLYILLFMGMRVLAAIHFGVSVFDEGFHGFSMSISREGGVTLGIHYYPPPSLLFLLPFIIAFNAQFLPRKVRTFLGSGAVLLVFAYLILFAILTCSAKR